MFQLRNPNKKLISLLQYGRSSSTVTEFNSKHEYLTHLEKTRARLPWGFAVGTSSFSFQPIEAPQFKDAQMNLTLIVPEKPTAQFAAVFTQNAFPGAPIKIGRKLLANPNQKIGGILVNNKISNVCARGGGVQDAKEVCDAVARLLHLDGDSIIPSSTGVIGWQIPVEDMIANLPETVRNLQSDSILPAAQAIMTTDLYPKIRSADICGGRIVGIAKGAGMIEPNMATMLSYILTDLSIPRDILQSCLNDAVVDSFNSISIDSDESTSDTVVILSSEKIPFDLSQLDQFKLTLQQVCKELSQDIARNAEGAHHLLQVSVLGAPSKDLAKKLGKAVINSPLFKCAVTGNDPNVGRLVMAVGKFLGSHNEAKAVVGNMNQVRMKMGGIPIFSNGEFTINDEIESELNEHMKQAQLTGFTRGGLDTSSTDYPPHEKAVQVEIDLGMGSECAEVTGVDLTSEYVSINADYRS